MPLYVRVPAARVARGAPVTEHSQPDHRLRGISGCGHVSDLVGRQVWGSTMVGQLTRSDEYRPHDITLEPSDDVDTGDDLLIEPLERMDALTVPSIMTVRATFTAMQKTVDTISSDCRIITETLQSLGDALGVITNGAEGGQQFSGFGLVGLPIAGAIRAVKGVASQYVRQQTGSPLNSWTDLVATSSAQFTGYLSQLAAVGQLAQRYGSAAGNEIDPQQAQGDYAILRDVRWHTQAWKQVLARVAQVSAVVDAILQAKLGDESEADDHADERSSGFSSLQRKFKEAQVRTVEQSGDLREWLLQPFVDIRDQVMQLPTQTEQLSHQVALLEVLLDLQIAEIRAYLGQSSPAEANITGVRVAANVMLPELAKRLAETRERADAYESYQNRLESARATGTVSDRAYRILADEYRTNLVRIRSTLGRLESQAEIWRREGPALLDVCSDWAELELDVLDGRRQAEHREPASDRRILLQRERKRLDEVRNMLATL